MDRLFVPLWGTIWGSNPVNTIGREVMNSPVQNSISKWPRIRGPSEEQIPDRIRERLRLVVSCKRHRSPGPTQTECNQFPFRLTSLDIRGDALTVR